MKNNWQLLFNPFVKIAGWQAFGLGLFIVLLSGIIGSFTYVAFDGVLDSHIGTELSLKDSLLFLAIDIVSITVVMFITGIIISKQCRFIDILGTMTLARAPLLLATLLGFFVTVIPTQELLNDDRAAIFANPGILIFALIGILLVIWFVALMYNGFKVSTGAKGTKLIVGFIIGLLVAEIVSKILIHVLTQIK